MALQWSCIVNNARSGRGSGTSDALYSRSMKTTTSLRRVTPCSAARLSDQRVGSFAISRELLGRLY